MIRELTNFQPVEIMQYDCDVLIIGAGVSGIGAGRRLVEHGLSCIIVEGRDRIGGRVNPVYLTKNLMLREKIYENESVITIQLGANWMHGLDETMNPLFTLSKKLGLKLHETSSDDEPGDDVLVFDSGCISMENKYRPIDTLDYQNLVKRYDWMRNYCDKNKEIILKGQSNNPQLSLNEFLENLLQLSCEEFGSISPLHQRCFQYFLDRLCIDLAAPLKDQSVYSYLDGDSVGACGEALIGNGGYMDILNYIATMDTPLDIRLSQIVQRIEVLVRMNEQKELIECGIELTCTNGTQYRAKKCLVTIPLGVLQSNSVEISYSFLGKDGMYEASNGTGDQGSTLPHAMLRGMNPLLSSLSPQVDPPISKQLYESLSPGIMNVVWLWYPYQFWPDGFNYFGVARDAATQPVAFSTFLAPPKVDQFGQKQPILMCQLIDQIAENIEKMNDFEIASVATDVLRKMFGNDIPDAVGCLHSAWRMDPFSKGSWTYLNRNYNDSCDVESISAGTSLESESINSGNNNANDNMLTTGRTLYYGGEAVQSLYRGTVHGAYLSGVEQADLIVSSFLLPSHDK